MNEHKGRVEEWDDSISLLNLELYVVGAGGKATKVYGKDEGKEIISLWIAQGNAFYDRDSAKLAARQRAAQIKWERLEKVADKRYDSGDCSYLCAIEQAYKEMGEDMEFLK